MWRDLTMQQRSNLMQATGIFDPARLRQVYDAYHLAQGGHIHQGDDSYSVRQRLYDNITPYEYDKPVKRVFNALVNNKRDTEMFQDTTRFGNFSQYDLDENGYMPSVDDLWAQYLGIPQDKRHNIQDKVVVSKSDYKPTQSKEDTQYYKLDLPNESWEDIIRESRGFNPEPYFEFKKDGRYTKTATLKYRGRPQLKIGESRSFLPYDYLLNIALRNITAGRGYDDNGEYVSYYDKWDLAPIFEGINKDQSFGIGKPIELYDRLYLDDYYGIGDKGGHSTWLPEVTVTPNEYKKGGSIHIKHPGRLTALKKRTGKTEAELWATGNKDYRRMITFARNSRKWKHQDGGNLFQGGDKLFVVDKNNNVSNISPITKKFLVDPIYNYMDYWYQNRPEQISQLNKYGASTNIRQAVNDAKNISVYLQPFTDKYGQDVAGAYTGNVELYNKAFDPYGSWSTRSVLLHELSHGLNDLIKQPIKNGGIYINESPILEQVSDFNGDKYFGYHTDENGERVPLFSNEYLDNPDEIYSRLMQFRYDQRLDPKKQYNDKDYLRFLDNGSLHKFNLDQYSQDYILHLLNNVVYNDQQDNDNKHIAQKGGDIIWDNMGQWNPRNYGKPTGIQGNKLGTYIVNNDDPQDLFAVDNYGNTRFIPANTRGPFYFPGSSVVEYPLKYQLGGLFKKKETPNYLYATYGLNDYGQPRYEGSYNNPIFGYQPLSGINQSIGRNYSMPDYGAVAYTSYPIYMNEEPAGQVVSTFDPVTLRNRQMYAESAGNPRAKSHAGAQGLFQIMPDTLKWYQEQTKDYGDVYDPIYNERVRNWYMDWINARPLLQREDINEIEKQRIAIASYNRGYNAVKNIYNKYGDDWLNHLPKETRDYVNFIVDKVDSEGCRTNKAYDDWYNKGNKYIKQYGGLIKPFSYTDIPVVRYGFGGYSYI